VMTRVSVMPSLAVVTHGRFQERGGALGLLVREDVGESDARDGVDAGVHIFPAYAGNAVAQNCICLLGPVLRPRRAVGHRSARALFEAFNPNFSTPFYYTMVNACSEPKPWIAGSWSFPAPITVTGWLHHGDYAGQSDIMQAGERRCGPAPAESRDQESVSRR
jgi:hypothetical protein